MKPRQKTAPNKAPVPPTSTSFVQPKVDLSSIHGLPSFEDQMNRLGITESTGTGSTIKIEPITPVPPPVVVRVKQHNPNKPKPTTSSALGISIVKSAPPSQTMDSDFDKRFRNDEKRGAVRAAPAPQTMNESPAQPMSYTNPNTYQQPLISQENESSSSSCCGNCNCNGGWCWYTYQPVPVIPVHHHHHSSSCCNDNCCKGCGDCIKHCCSGKCCDNLCKGGCDPNCGKGCLDCCKALGGCLEILKICR